MRTHELKTWPRYFERVKNGTKTFEVRNNDRDFQAGDRVVLKEFDPNKPAHEAYTGRNLEFSIGYVLVMDGLYLDHMPKGIDDVVVFSLLPPKELQ